MPEAGGGRGGEMGAGKDQERSVRGRRKGVVFTVWIVVMVSQYMLMSKLLKVYTLNVIHQF